MDLNYFTIMPDTRYAPERYTRRQYWSVECAKHSQGLQLSLDIPCEPVGYPRSLDPHRVVAALHTSGSFNRGSSSFLVSSFHLANFLLQPLDHSVKGFSFIHGNHVGFLSSS